MKNTFEAAVKKSISMPGLMLNDAVLDQKRLRLSTFSDYVQLLIRERLEQVMNGTHPKATSDR